MNESTIELYDTSHMRKLLLAFPAQVEEAVRIGSTIRIPYKKSGIDTILVTGLGGSAIGGDLLRSYTADELTIPFHVNRGYTLPAFVNDRTLVIVSSYSGNTEETIAAHAEAIRRKARIVCITSGGETENIARKLHHPVIKIPRGLPPRAALGYSFFPSLAVLTHLKLISSKQREIQETITLLRRKAKAYGALRDENLAIELAKKLYNKLVVIYSAADRLDAVNLRWRGQLAENAKILAFGHVIPEMNHNELVGWKVLRRLMEEISVVVLRDRGDHDRVRMRIEITKSIVGEYAAKVLEVQSEGRSPLARMFSLIALGDWLSFYLAMFNGVDPTPVKVIDYLKFELSRD